MTRRVVYGVRPHAAGVERVSTPFFIVAEGATPSGRGVLHSNARAACAARCACARHAPRGEGSKWKDACIEAYYVPKPRIGPVPPRCMRYRMRRAVCDVHVASARVARCIGARRALHRRALHRSNTSLCKLHQHVASLRVASMHRRALHVALVRVACCMLHRCLLHRCTLHGASERVACCIMHRRVARCIGARCVLHRRRAAVPCRILNVLVLWCA